MKSRYLHAIGLVLLTIVLWSPSFQNGFVWDDQVLIVKNETNLQTFHIRDAFLRDFWSTETEAGASNYYRPLVTLSYMLDYELYGMNAAGFHVTNIIIHTASVVCLWILLTWFGAPMLIASASVAMWAIHPGIGESVAWISGRTDSLATLFALLSMLAALKAYSGKKVEERHIFFSSFLFLGALLSKESAIVTPIVVLLFLFLKKRPGRSLQKLLVLYGCAGAVWFAMRCMVLSRPIGTETGEGVSTLIGILSLMHVWGGLLWPPLFRIEYGSSLTPGALFVGAACGAAIIGRLLYVVLNNRDTKLVQMLFVSALVAFIPSVLAVMLKSMIGARLVYMSSAFAIPGITLGVISARGEKSWQGGVALLLVVYALLTVQRAQLWRSDEVLFTKALEATDASSRNHLNLGIALYNKGDLSGALTHLSTEMETAARDQQHYMLALLFTGIQCEGRAEDELKRSMAANPAYYSATHNLAGLLAVQGRLDEARTRLMEFGKRYPQSREQVAKQIQVLEKLPKQARRDPINGPWCATEDTLRLLFSDALALNRLAGEKLQSRQLEIAEVLIRAALRVDPYMVAARLNQAQLYILEKNERGAREILEGILAADPSESRAMNLLRVLSASPAR